MPHIEVNGVELYYEWHGPPDAPILALINGVLMSTASWGLQIKTLARRYRLLLHDCRGQGQSAHPPGLYTMRQHADDLSALLAALGIEQAHLAGISYGGEIALLMGIAHPQQVRSLFVSSAVSEVRPTLRGTIESWIAAARTGDGELLYRCSVTDNFGEPWLAVHPNWAELSIPRYCQLDLEAVIALCECFLGLDCTADLPQIAAPTTVVVGELDALKPLEPYARLIAGRVPNADLIVLGGAGHACCIETPRAWNAALLGHLALVG
ncbi:MAG: alpha/beta fold hydrolase [Anaerolineae bacterium]|nr:alpha/beta fold hydrolase [Anaerolineae bacterium]